MLQKIERFKSMDMYHFTGDMEIHCSDKEWNKMMMFNFKKIETKNGT
jgi:hypothetical protein